MFVFTIGTPRQKTLNLKLPFMSIILISQIIDSNNVILMLVIPCLFRSSLTCVQL